LEEYFLNIWIIDSGHYYHIHFIIYTIFIQNNVKNNTDNNKKMIIRK